MTNCAERRSTTSRRWPWAPTPAELHRFVIPSEAQSRELLLLLGKEPALALVGMRMGAVVHLHHVLDRKLRIALRSGKPLVAEHLLDGAQVSALLQHVGAERMTQRVRM